jgi:hypothetical protein
MLLMTIGLLLAICGPANQVAQNQTPPPVPAGPVPNLTNVTPADLQTWNYINKSTVEQACLTEAKVKAGSYAWAVQGCTCDETAGVYVKDYACGIATVQGTISGQISCVLANKTCFLVSSYGNGNMTFDQIRQQLPAGG